jgi:16S rRNA (cytosine967-C5)-methyltransferase
MSRFHSYITSAQSIVEAYKKGSPLSHQLKLFFQTDKKYGSRDRKTIASISYHYFRTFYLLQSIESFEEKIIKATFLCESEENELLKSLSPELNEFIGFDVKDKIEYLNIKAASLFNFNNHLSTFIDAEKFAVSFFSQPDVFIRIRPGKNNKVIESLKKAAILHELIGENTIAINNGTSVENCIQLNKDAVIQDFNSQHVLDFYTKERDKDKYENVWDCCAASGGKSILLYDICNGKVKLTVSDIRENILTNLQLRCKEAGINLQKKFVQDLSEKSGLLLDEKFSVILCDVPCSGSGTWGRTPEQYYSFEENQIETFVKKQKNIVINTISHLAKDGWFIYITCSVFKAENEDMVDFIQENFSCQLLEMKYLKGYENKADTMFVAYFKS